jgi:hypothetical protein
MAPVMLGLTAFPLAAIGIAAYLVVSAGPQLMAVAGAILLLSCCLLLSATVVVVKLSRHEAWLWSQQGALRGLTRKADEALARIADVERQSAAATDVAAIAADISAMRRDLHERMPVQPRAREKSVAEPPSPELKKTDKAAEQLTLLLEPVVDLPTGTTSHYRAMVGLGDGPKPPLLPFQLEPLAPAMEFAQAAAGAQGLATVAQVLADGAADIGNREAA